MAIASPKLATSTPSSLSLVDRSAPGNVASPAEQPVGDDLGHRVAGGDQAVAPTLDGGALAHGVDVLGSLVRQAIVGEDAAALPDVEAGGAGQRRPTGARPPRRRPGRSSSAVPSDELDGEAPVVLRGDRARAGAGVDLNAEVG